MVFYPIHYSARRVMPFATAGVGVGGYHLSDEARGRAADPRVYGIGNLRSIDKRFAFNYGGGVKVGLLSRLGIRADFRHIFSDVPSYGLPKESSNRNQIVLPIQGKLQTYEGSAGIYFHFLK
jgi:opacity protein-like surface antigen